jgi:hypothetical protein
MVNNHFVPAAQVQGLAVYPFSGNWGTTGEKALIAYGVFLDNTTVYNLGKSYYETRNLKDKAACGYLPYIISTTTGQYVKSRRDQGHTQFPLGNGILSNHYHFFTRLIALCVSVAEISPLQPPNARVRIHQRVPNQLHRALQFQHLLLRLS